MRSGILIHEATHNLVFRGSWKNKALAIFANLPHGAPAAIEFRYQHLMHHRYLGDARELDGRDTQAPTYTEIHFVGCSFLRRIASFTFGRFFYKSRPANAVPRDAWLVANWAACLLADAALIATCGFRPVVFLLLSALVAFGPHALGGRRLAEHLTIRRQQPTNSYYGPLNRVSFDVGYHVEHHDFPAIPWRNMRRLRAMAREHYDSLATVASWSRLIVAYLLVDPTVNLAHYTGLSTDFLEELDAASGEGGHNVGSWAPPVGPEPLEAGE